jgi:3-dehydroquinate synthase
MTNTQQVDLQVNIPAKSSLHYPIMIAPQLLTNWQSWIKDYAPSKKIIIVSDSNVANLYGNNFCKELNSAGYKCQILHFTAGEASKSATTKLELEEKMFSFGCDRHTLCIALGGGVVGDLAGFTAATYMRGMNYIQIPTSLLAMIDSSVGGKTAVNSSYGKNIIGAFWQPQAVIMDTELLKTLPREQIINGFFEAVKIFLTLNAEQFNFCCTHLDAILNLEQAPLVQVLREAVALKAHVVEIDEQEQNLRMILNFGHTVAHALEKLSDYKVLHGYAVAIGMLVEAKIAELSGLLDNSDYKLITEFLAKLGITPQLLAGYKITELISAMRGDKKNKNQQIVLVLLSGIGQVKNIDNKVAFAVDESIIEAAFLNLMT